MPNVEIPSFGIVEFPDDMPEEAINAAIAQNFRFETPSPIASVFSPSEKLPAGTMMPVPIEPPPGIPYDTTPQPSDRESGAMQILKAFLQAPHVAVGNLADRLDMIAKTGLDISTPESEFARGAALHEQYLRDPDSVLSEIDNTPRIPAPGFLPDVSEFLKKGSERELSNPVIADDPFTASRTTKQLLTEQPATTVTKEVIRNSPNLILSMLAGKAGQKVAGLPGTAAAAFSTSYTLESGDIWGEGKRELIKQFGSEEKVPPEAWNLLADTAQNHGAFNAALDAITPASLIGSKNAKKELIRALFSKQGVVEVLKKVGSGTLTEAPTEFVQEKSTMRAIEQSTPKKFTQEEKTFRPILSGLTGAGLGATAGGVTSAAEIKAQEPLAKAKADWEAMTEGQKIQAILKGQFEATGKPILKPEKPEFPTSLPVEARPGGPLDYEGANRRQQIMQAFETREQQEAAQKAADEARADTDSVRTKIMDSLRAQQTEREIGGERIAPRTAMEEAFKRSLPEQQVTEVPRETTENATQPSGIKTDLPTGLNIEPAHESALTEEDRAIEKRFAEQLNADVDKAVADYGALPGAEGGKVINTDLARELSPDYSASKESRSLRASAVHEPASALIKEVYRRKLAEPDPTGHNLVTFTAGGSGAGKSVGIKEVQQLMAQSQVIYDTNMNTFKSAKDKIDMALKAGKHVQIMYVARDPVVALMEGTLKRAERMGRTVALREHLRTHKGSVETIKKLREQYANDPRVDIMYIDNTRGKGEARVGDETLPDTLNFDNIEQRLNEALDNAYREGKIGEATYRGTKGTTGEAGIARGEGPREGARTGVREEPQQERPSGEVSLAATPPAWLKQNSFDPQYDPFPADVIVPEDEVTRLRHRSVDVEDTDKYRLLRREWTRSIGRLYYEHFPIVARALRLLHDAGLPKSSLLTVDGVIGHQNVNDTFAMVHWGIPINVGNNSIIGITHDILEYVRQNPTDKRGQFAMLAMLAHEIGHAVDIRQNFANSVDSPLFDLEIRRTPNTSSGYDVRIGPVLNELMMAHGKNSMGLSQYLAYPMAWVKEYSDTTDTQKRISMETFIQKESFAQLYALYYTVGQTTSGREALMKVMPQAMKFMDEVHHATATVHTVAERDRGVRQAFQVDSPVGGEMEGPRMAAREGTASTQDRGAGEGVRGVRDADTGRGVVRPVVETPGTTEDNARHARDTREAERAEPARDTGQAGRTAGEAAPDLSRRAGREADRGVERAGLAFESAKADDFHQAITEAKEASRFGSSVAVYSKAEYAKMKTFLLPDKSAGFALKGDDLVSVFSSGTHPGIASDILDQAIAQGARRLDAFDTRLPGIYSTKGFKAVARLKWNDEFAPADWNKYTYRNFNNGKPDVVFMVYDPNAPLYKPGDGKLVESYDEAVRLQDEALQGKIDVAATRAVPQTETPEFKRWFGDSKVVDDDGKPLVVYRSNAVDSVLSGKPQIPESGMDGLRGNAELLSNLLQSPTFRTEGLGGFDTPTQRVVLAAVRSFSLNPQILGSVVDLVPVDVVDILARGKASPDSLFRDDAVLKNLLSVDGEGSVSTAVDVADALVAAVASVTTEASGVSVYGVGPLLNGRAAGRAGEVNVFLSSHDGALSAVDATSVAQKSNTVGNRGTFDPNVPDISGTGLAPPRPPVTPPISPSPDSPRRRSAMSIYDKKVGKPPKPFLGILKEWTSGRRFEHEFLDTGIPFKLMVEKVAPDIGPQDNPYIGWKLLSGDSALIEDWLGINPGTQGGAPFRLGDRIKVENYGKSLREILAPVAHDAETLKEFEAYLIGRRANELYGKEKEHLFTRKEIDELLALETPAFKKVAEEVYAYNDRLLQYSVDGGFLDPKVAEKFREYVNYIPFYREAEYEGDVGGPRKGSLYHRLKGGKQNLRSPLQNLIDNTATVIHAVNRNAVLNNALDMSKAFPGAKAWMEQVPVPMQVMNLATDRIVNQLVGQGVYVNRETADELAVMQTFFMKKPIGDEKNRIIILKRNGKTIAVKIHDPMLWKTLHAFTPTELGLIVDILAVPAQTLRTGVVVSPDFMSRNFLRDTLSAYIQGDKTFIPVVGSIKGFVHVARASETYRLYRAMGGAYADFWHGDSKEAAVSLSRLAKLSLFPGSRLLNPAGWWRTLKKVGSITEAGSRTRALEKYIDGTIEGALKGAVEAREVTVDFGMHGVNQTMRILERITPFLNPAKQGMYKMSRTFGNHPMTTLLRGAPIVLLTFALWMLNRDEKWYKDLEDWEKDMYWHFDVGLRTDKGKVVPLRLPKPFEYGAVFGSFWEAGLESMYREDAEGMKRAWGTIENVFTLRMIPTVASVPLELWSNKSLFTERSIVPEGMETLEPYLQYGAGTSNVSKAVGQAFNASPYKIDHTVRNVFGTLGVYATSLMDHPVGNAMGYPSKPAVRPQQWPLLKVFVSDPDRGGNKAVTEFYELLQESRTRYASWSYLQYDFDYLDKQAEKSGDLMFLKDTAENAAHIMAELRKSNRMIRDDKTLTPEQKRVLIDENGEQIKQIAETYRDLLKGAKR